MKGLTRNSYGVYKLRLRIPYQAQRFFNRKEINKSLDTKDKIKAESKALLLYNAYQDILKVVKMGTLTQEQTQELVDSFVIGVLNQEKLNRVTVGYGLVRAVADEHRRVFSSDSAAQQDVLLGLLSEHGEYLISCDYDPMIPLATSLLNSIGITYDNKNETHRLFLHQLLLGQIEIYKEAINRQEGIFNPKYDKPIALPTLKPKKEKKTHETYKKAYQLFKRYYNKENVTKETKDDTYRVIDKLMVIVGENNSIEDTDLDDLYDTKEIVERLPNFNKQPYKSMDFEEILQLPDIPDDDIITDNRVQSYIKHIKKFFSFCYKQRIVDYDPSATITVSVEEAKKEPFTDEEVKSLLNIIYNLEDDTKLLYLSYIYSGMRREEIYNSTIKEVEGIKYFSIEKGKNTSSIRAIPLHNELLKIGLDNERLQKAKSILSFSTLGRKFNESIKTQVTDSRKKTLHSLRHTVATKLQNKGVNDSLIREIIGHSAQDTLNKVYTATTSINLTKERAARLKEAIDKLSY